MEKGNLAQSRTSGPATAGAYALSRLTLRLPYITTEAPTKRRQSDPTVMSVLADASRRGEFVVSLPTGTTDLAEEVNVIVTQKSDHARRPVFEIVLRNSRGQEGRLNVRLDTMKGLGRLLTVSANAGLFVLVGTAAIGSTTTTAGRQANLSAPFYVLEAVLRSRSKAFTWCDTMKDAIAEGNFEVRRLGIVTFLPIAGGEADRVLRFLRCILGPTIADDRDRLSVISDYFDAKVNAVSNRRHLISLTLKFLYNQRRSLDLKLAPRTILDASWPIPHDSGKRNALRADLDMAEDALKHLLKQQGLGHKTKVQATASALAKAMTALDKAADGGSTATWLLRDAFERRLPLKQLLTWTPEQLKEQVQQLISRLEKNDPGKAAGIRQWYELGFEHNDEGGRAISAETFIVKRAESNRTRQEARTITAMFMAVGVDLDIPLGVYTALFVQSNFALLTPNEREHFAVNTEDGRHVVVSDLMEAGRERWKKQVDEIIDRLENIIPHAAMPMPASKQAKPTGGARPFRRVEREIAGKALTKGKAAKKVAGKASARKRAAQ